MQGNRTNRGGIVYALASLIVLFSLLLNACTPASQPAASSTEAVELRIAVLPILDALPMYVALAQGLFESHGVKVTFIPVASAAERDQVINAGQADGMINEVVSTIFYNKSQTQVQIVRFARTAAPGAPMFRILASGKSQISSVADLKGVPIGISEGTVIEYLTDRLLGKEGFAPSEVQKVAVPKIPDRMALLGTGEMKAGMLPDPLSTLAIQQGAKMILDDSAYPELSYSTIAFRKAVIDQNPEAIRGFLAAIEEATLLINEDGKKWTNLLTEQNLIPAALAATFEVPDFVLTGVPNETQWNDVLAWVKDKGLVEKDVSYHESVTDSYLPH